MNHNPFDPGYFSEHEIKEFGFKSVGKNVLIAKSCTIIGLENISIGNNVRIDGYSTITATQQGYMNIGSYVHIGGYCAIFAGAGVVMKDFSGLSQGVKIYSTSDDYSGSVLTNPTVPVEYTGVIRKPVSLEKHVIVGAQTIIMPGIVVAEGCAVGANSLITKSTESWSIYFGSPAKKLKQRNKNIINLENQLINSAKKCG